jgi:hypothetical protein
MYSSIKKVNSIITQVVPGGWSGKSIYVYLWLQVGYKSCQDIDDLLFTRAQIKQSYSC